MSVNGVVVAVFVLITIAVSSKSQCLVPAIVSSSSDDLCQVISQGSLSYTCRDQDAVIWTSSVWTNAITVITGVPPAIPQLNVAGVSLMENHYINGSCIHSTLTFNESLTSLAALNGAILTCGVSPDDPVTIPIVVPVTPGSPTLLNVSSSSCDGSGNQVTLQWRPPFNTGGQGVEIERYYLDVIEPPDFICPADRCNVTGTNTTITGLQCNTSYLFSVRADNCRGEGSSLQSMRISVNPTNPPGPSFQDTPCFDGNNIRVSLMEYSNSCLSNIMFVVTSNCSENELETNVSQALIMLPTSRVDSCEVIAFVTSDCGDSSQAAIMVNGTCSTMPPTPSPSPTISTLLTSTELRTSVYSIIQSSMITPIASSPTNGSAITVVDIINITVAAVVFVLIVCAPICFVIVVCLFIKYRKDSTTKMHRNEIDDVKPATIPESTEEEKMERRKDHESNLSSSSTKETNPVRTETSKL